jgi:hypothetical protein
MIEYGALGANASAGTSMAASPAAKAADVLGKRLGDAVQNAGSVGSPPAQQKPSPSPDDLMRSNRQALEQSAREHGATLHITSEPQGATLLIDHRPVAHTPADLRLSAGKHNLALRSPAYLDWSQDVSVSDGDKLSFDPKLQQDKQTQQARQAPSDNRIINLSF